MYSPKISEALIPRVYRAAKEAKIPMTRWVNRAVEQALPNAAATELQCLPSLNGLDAPRLSDVDANTSAGGEVG